MVAASRDSKDVARVVKALANGLRSATNFGDTTELPAERVRVALERLAAKDHVTWSSVMGETLWRLSDDGQDMLKESMQPTANGGPHFGAHRKAAARVTSMHSDFYILAVQPAR